MKRFFFCILFIFFNMASAKSLTTEQKLLEFNQLVGQIQSAYGPLEYKQKVQNINVTELTLKYRGEIETSKTNHYGRSANETGIEENNFTQECS